MNKDFHYYATFLAARTAGYDDEQSLLIANAAQFVDEYTIETATKFSEKVKGVQIQPTFEDLISHIKQKTTTIKKNWQWNEKDIYRSIRLWCSFHFLPGNLNLKETYNGATSYEVHNAYPDMWSYSINGSGYEEEFFRCMCLNNSDVLKKMVDNLFINTSFAKIPLDNKALIQTGIMMHVLADTWAHNYFSGTPSWFINDATCDLSSHYPAPGFNSYLYLGHCQLQHVPDRPFQEFTFKPQWKSNATEKTITKNNKEGFLSAFKQMAYALRCQLMKGEFMLNKYDIENDTGFNECLATNSTFVSEVLSQTPPTPSLLEKKKDDNEEYFCGIWKDKFNEKKFIDQSKSIIKPPSEYNANKWFDIFEAAVDKKATNLYMFNECAVSHSQALMNILHLANIFIDCEDSKRKIIIRLKSCSRKKYIYKNFIGITSSDCPSLHSSEYIYLLAICDRKSDTLSSGNLIQLKTLEHDNIVVTSGEAGKKYIALENSDNKKYMTADKAMTIDLPGDYIFYQHKGYGSGIQYWEINKFDDDLSVKDKISSGDKVYFRSAAYPNTVENRRFLAPKDSVNYLTTRHVASIDDNVLWEIEIFDTSTG